MTTLAGYSINNIIYSDENSFVAHALGADRQPVLVKYQNTDYPTVDLDARWAHEFDILRSVTSDYVIKAQAICRHNNNPLLVLEYFPSAPLSELIKNDNLTFDQKIYIAYQLALAVGEIHRHQIIHRGLTPQSILINAQSLALKISDVGLASRLDRESQLNPVSIWATLEYISPELTGRTNLDVDYRSDFYSLGAILYELFCGNPPFHSDDPLALLHAHIAGIPTALHNLEPSFPQTLSTIIQKLLAKAPDDRYQSSHGIQTDIKECLKQWQDKGSIDHFPLALHDIPERFCIAQKSYGREAERSKLLEIYQNVSQGNTELILISGDAGIGKSELTHELHKPALKSNGLLIRGKCNQYNKNQPYSALIQAFNTLVEQLLSKNNDVQQHWRKTLKHVLGNNAAVITEIIPDLTLIIGDAPALEPLPASESEQRLHITFINFVKALSSPEHPLVLLLDDLQWVDHPTLKLLTQLLTYSEGMSLLIVGAYRSNEIDKHHPLSSWQHSISHSQPHIHTFHLEALAVGHVQQLLTDTLQCTPTKSAPLAELCFTKTQGNPFFLKQFLYALYEHHDIHYDHDAGEWLWDIEEIQQRNITDNVVEFMMKKLHQLEPDTQHLISLASLLGDCFTLRLLSIVYEQSAAETARSLWPVLQHGLVLPLNENYKFNDSPEKLIPTHYRFLHDRVQQAAYSLINNEDRAALMLKTGRLLLANMPHMPHIIQEQHLFTILGLINNSRHLITDATEKKQLLALNIRAGINAKKTSAFIASANFLSIAKILLPKDAWQSTPEQTLSVYKELAESCYLAGDFDAADALYPIAIEAAPTPMAKISLIMIQASQYQQQGRFADALPGLLSGLSLLGCHFPSGEAAATEQLPVLFTETHNLLNSRTNDSLLNAKDLMQPEHLLQMDLYSALTVVLYQMGRFNTYGINSCKMLMLSLNQGLCDLTPLAYLTNAWAMSRMGETYSRCYDMAKLALTLTDQRGSRYHRVLIYQGYAAFFQHWGEPLENTFSLLEKSVEWGYEGLNLTAAGHAVLLGAMNKFSKGETLENIEHETTQGLDFLCRTHQQSTENLVRFGVIQPILALQGETEDRYSFNTKELNITDFFDGDYSTPSMELAIYSHAMIRHAYLMDDASAQQQFIQNLPIIDACLPHSPALTESTFYIALTLLSSLAPSDVNFTRDLTQAKHYADQFKQWAGYCPENYDHLHLLIEAEISRVSESFDLAMPHYNLALDAAEKAGFIQHEALAKERYACFWRSLGQIRVASAFITEAHRLYYRWGAVVKCDLIVETWPQITFRQHERRRSTYDKSLSNAARHSRAINQTDLLDLHSLLKANQVLSEEIKLDSLLKKIMLILLENAGAQRGALVLSSTSVIEDDSPLIVEVSGKLNIGGEVDCELTGKPLVDKSVITEDTLNNVPPEILPESIIHYVQQTQSTLLINTPSTDPRFSQSDYLQQQNPKSILCLPITAQGKLVSIVYLENNLTTNAFTLQHKETLEILSAQVAVSLVNARLYDMVLESLGSADRINTLKTEALEAAESANRLKDEFMSTITHELLTPINGIRLSLSLLKPGVSGEYCDFLETANDSSQHLLNIIESTVTFVEARRGTIQLKHKPLDVKQLLENVFSLFNSTQSGTYNSQNNNVALHFDWVPKDPLWIFGDEDKLSTIVIQLMKNAYAFTKSGTITLHCAVANQEGSETALNISVMDTGIGIHDEVKTKIFEAFNQADNSMRRQHGGMGIGLTLVKELLSLMGGSLHLDSIPQKGSTFTLHIPVEITTSIAATPHHALQHTTSTTHTKRESSPDSFKQSKILVVEDNNVNMTLLCKVLEKSDYHPLRAYHGEEALSVLDENDDIAAILMDCQMPIMDGYEATRKIRQQDKYKQLPIIAVTANVSEEDQQRCYEAGMSEFLPKPVKRAALESTLLKWLRASKHATTQKSTNHKET